MLTANYWEYLKDNYQWIIQLSFTLVSVWYIAEMRWEMRLMNRYLEEINKDD